MSVYKAMASVMADLSKVGVGKTQKNTQQGFMYRGVDDVMNALAPALARHGLLIVPQILSREVSERQSKSGGALFHCVLCVEFSFISAEDGSIHKTQIIGEAMDSGDKATNKALAIAYKYVCFQTFCIPLVGADPDSETHEVEHAEPTPIAHHKQNNPKAKEYADRFAEAVQNGIDGAVFDIHQEIVTDEEFYRQVWSFMPSGMRRQLKEIIERQKADRAAA